MGRRHVEVVTGRRLVLVVALSTSRWGGQFRRTTLSERDAGELSEREQEIVRLISLGSTGPEIADELQIAHDTVRTHVRNSMTKLRARSRAHLVANALSSGAVPAELTESRNCGMADRTGASNHAAMCLPDPIICFSSSRHPA